jgi:DNA ligase-1
VQAPPLLLAESWTGDQDPTGWWLSEKLDGVRAFWDGKQFLSRQGNRYHAPDWFLVGLPDTPLDGELWLGRKKFQRTVSIVRRHDGCDLWKEIRFLVFDSPTVKGGFEQRLEAVNRCITSNQYAQAHQHFLCSGREHLFDELARVESLGGEGLMLRRPGSRYEVGRSASLLKVKTFQDAEAVVIAHEPGTGRHKGRLGALLVQMNDGTRFAVGTGFSDAERESPPLVGSTITFRYQELSDRGVPRFPSYRGIRTDVESSPKVKKGAMQMSATRRFELCAGTSNKFWEIALKGSDVTVRFGRIGTQGQSTVKSFPDETAASNHAAKLVREKTGKGYIEVS